MKSRKIGFIPDLYQIYTRFIPDIFQILLIQNVNSPMNIRLRDVALILLADIDKV